MQLTKPSVVYKVRESDNRLEMIVHTSRILTMEKKIPQAQVGNPDVLEVTPLSPNQVQISAKATGVTQVNLWDEDKKVYTVDVLVVGDARELTLLLQSTFPNSVLKVTPVSSSVMISGYVDKPEYVRSHHPNRRAVLSESHQQYVRRRGAASVAARQGDGGVADQAPPSWASTGPRSQAATW